MAQNARTDTPFSVPHGPCIRTACRIADPADSNISFQPLADPPALAVRIPVTEWRLPAFVMGFSPVFSRKSRLFGSTPASVSPPGAQENRPERYRPAQRFPAEISARLPF
ncbi:MAG: hypothetical protein C6W57_15765 [Caldibacillus debilis]|nr:MAG: hypothetical protein BAA03_01985 [Caldibacillus debilis]REJ13699.1 MAG: hypothetical protein C6W57_15765 [Caldibacillus debilis]